MKESSSPFADRTFGCWAGLVEAAGFPRPNRSTRYAKTSSGSSRAAIADAAVSQPDEQQQDSNPAATADGSVAAGAD
jgi:hypothetical protein